MLGIFQGGNLTEKSYSFLNLLLDDLMSEMMIKSLWINAINEINLLLKELN